MFNISLGPSSLKEYRPNDWGDISELVLDKNKERKETKERETWYGHTTLERYGGLDCILFCVAK